jgi:predicted small secreted protein
MMTAKALRAAIAVMALSTLALSACNTIEGAGQDIRNTGAWIEKKASDKK